jgi:hypothetical protein
MAQTYPPEVADIRYMSSLVFVCVFCLTRGPRPAARSAQFNG